MRVRLRVRLRPRPRPRPRLRLRLRLRLRVGVGVRVRAGAGRASVGVLVARVWEGGVDAPCEQRVEERWRPALKRVTRGGRAAERGQPERAAAPQLLSDRGEAGEVAQRRQAELRLQRGPLLGARHK